ncbi:MAG: uncharacterized protein QG669_88 [Patescibacteria group bacterium]|jgi:uncharacterized protein YqgC (DUF456 family)|nr:uncharacterized protein [Patescibacteria group bacterium]MDQ5961696.1 uncharacterized protein [Patescibacteria group bacterium]
MGMGEFALLFVTFLLLVGSMFMTLIPALPAIPFMFLTVFGYAVVTKFTTLTVENLLVFAVIMIVSIFVDFLAGIIGAKYGGAGKKSLIYGFVGMLLGTLIMPPFGSLLGLFAGVVLSEILTYKDHHKAIRAATGAVLGVVVGIMVNFALAFVFIGIFATYLFG